MGDQGQLRDDAVLLADKQAEALGRGRNQCCLHGRTGWCVGDPKDEDQMYSILQRNVTGPRKRMCSSSPAAQPRPKPWQAARVSDDRWHWTIRYPKCGFLRPRAS